MASPAGQVSLKGWFSTGQFVAASQFERQEVKASLPFWIAQQSAFAAQVFKLVSAYLLTVDAARIGGGKFGAQPQD